MKSKYYQYFSSQPKIFGFTLLELAITITVVGFLIGVGMLSWTTMMKARKIAYTKSILNQAKNCLITRIISTNQFPLYTFPSNCNATHSNEDINFCLCPLKDAWGNQIYYLEGLSNSGCLHESTNYVTDNPPAGQHRTSINSQIYITNPQGKKIYDIAFILISKGEDKTFDSPSYGNLFTSDSIAACINPSNLPNFSQNKDDIFIIITGKELQSIYNN
ncbi:type II secretion system protein [Desulfonauticus submarinus]